MYNETSPFTAAAGAGRLSDKQDCLGGEMLLLHVGSLCTGSVPCASARAHSLTETSIVLTCAVAHARSLAPQLCRNKHVSQIIFKSSAAWKAADDVRSLSSG